MFSKSSSRRAFLKGGSMAVAGTIIGGRQLDASGVTYVPADSPEPPNSYIEKTAAVDLQSLATQAVDAAKVAGAIYADVRISEKHSFEPGLNRAALETTFTFGIRALVNGSWGFSYGHIPATDAIIRCARNAVSSARISAALSNKDTVQPPEWIPGSSDKGEWTAPIKIDPFSVPVQQQVELLKAVGWTVDGIPGADGSLRAEWFKETRVFASTLGALQTQHFCIGDLRARVEYSYGSSDVTVRVPEVRCATTGYEGLLSPALQDNVKLATEQTVWLARLPVRQLDVGRYPVVFDGYVMGNLLARVVGPMLDLERVLGLESESSGSSKVTLDLLGTPIGSSLLTVSGSRGLPYTNAAKWDDEGFSPVEHNVINEGRLVDYHTSGATVGVLKEWYNKRGKPLASNGCATSVDGDTVVAIRPPHLLMQPASSVVSLEDLCKDVARGVVVLNNGLINTDQQLASGNINAASRNSSGMVFEISRGKVVRRLQSNSLQFNTLPFLKGLAAVGGEATTRYSDTWISKGVPWQTSNQSATAPAGLFKEINVISTSKV